MTISRARLLQILTERFNQEELQTLCFKLHVDYDSLRGEGKEGKARELISHFERRNRLPDLVASIQQLRPDLPWENTPNAGRNEVATNVVPPDTSNNQQKEVERSGNHNTWHFTLLTSSILVIIASVAWFFYEQSFEPLIGLIVGIAGIMVYKRKVNRAFDAIMAIILIIVFVVGFVTIVSSRINNPTSTSTIEPATLIPKNFSNFEKSEIEIKQSTDLVEIEVSWKNLPEMSNLYLIVSDGARYYHPVIKISSSSGTRDIPLNNSIESIVIVTFPDNVTASDIPTHGIKIDDPSFPVEVKLEKMIFE